uniref:hypothetical protein n=1 Tax=Pararhizobium sp. IMCC3301 TaxID=3067904 RepID=UPI0027413DBB|nr:hypothetical protein [Pararhizobium sp. IMCC3301]
MDFGEGYAVFCDEVRREANGKDFYIGVYTGGDYIIHKKPEDFQTPYFTIIATAMFDPIDPPDKVRELQIYFPGKDEPVVTFDFEVPEEAFGKAEKADDMSQFPHAPMVARASIGLSDVRFKESGFVRAVMQYGDKKFLLGRLKISFTPPEDARSAVGHSVAEP